LTNRSKPLVRLIITPQRGRIKLPVLTLGQQPEPYRTVFRRQEIKMVRSLVYIADKVKKFASSYPHPNLER